jgi:squalene-associated FAD-dependent desaturase
MNDDVLIVGGGLAGLAAASALAEQGLRVTLLESRNRLGGRAGSFVDSASQQLVDACQHVSMGCCTNFAHFCEQMGIAHFLEAQPTLFFMTPDGRCSRFEADPLPAPWHLARALHRAHYLSLGDKIRIAWGMLRLWFSSPDADPPLLDWLKRNRQSERTIRRFWNVVLVSALNDQVENLGLKYARKVFVDGFLTHPKGFEVQIPSVPLGRFYGEEMLMALKKRGVTLELNASVEKITISRGLQSFTLRDGRIVQAKWYLSALPFDRLLALLPQDLRDGDPFWSRLKQLRVSPITSVHLWYDRPVVKWPHLVLVDGLGQWLFNRGIDASQRSYLQVVISAAEEAVTSGHAQLLQRILDELYTLFPALREATLLQSRVITEHRATFRAVPGVDQLRPTQITPLDNFFLAGDWTQTGWPATMEGAVRSGYLAAEAILNQAGIVARCVQADLR